MKADRRTNRNIWDITDFDPGSSGTVSDRAAEWRTVMNRVHRPSGTGPLGRAGRALREWPGWFTLAAGAVLCVLGWYGVSGERLAARQLPYLASATVPGAALVVAGAVLIAARQSGGRGEATDRRLEQLYALLVAEAGEGEETGAAPAEGVDGGGRLVALPDGTLYHRHDCPLVAGKAAAAPVDGAVVRDRGLGACPVCEPPAPGGAGDGGAGDGGAADGGAEDGGAGDGGAGSAGAGSGGTGSGGGGGG